MNNVISVEKQYFNVEYRAASWTTIGCVDESRRDKTASNARNKTTSQIKFSNFVQRFWIFVFFFFFFGFFCIVCFLAQLTRSSSKAQLTTQRIMIWGAHIRHSLTAATNQRSKAKVWRKQTNKTKQNKQTNVTIIVIVVVVVDDVLNGGAAL